MEQDNQRLQSKSAGLLQAPVNNIGYKVKAAWAKRAKRRPAMLIEFLSVPSPGRRGA
jgi:hypothetical protein